MSQIDFCPRPAVPSSFRHASSEPPPAVAFERLLPRYERRFGSMPPLASASVEEVNRLMRCCLAEATRRPRQ